MESWNIRTFGARGDGAARDTDSIQRAVDACHEAGGGRVICPPGVYLTGSLLLKSGVELCVEQGATLRGSPDIADYSSDYCAAYHPAVAGSSSKNRIGRAHLICAVKARGIALTGLGTIDGNGPAFFGPVRPDGKAFSVPGWRPSHMTAFYECEDVRVERLHLLHSPCYTLWPYACNRVMVDGVTVYNHPLTPNGDGIDPDSCKDVLIRGCLVDTGDDAIAIKSMQLPGCDIAKACENVIVTGCVLRSRRMAVRLGVEGDSPIRNVVLSDLVLDGLGGLTFYAVEMKNWIAGDIRHGTPIEHVRCSNILMETRSAPVVAMMNPGARAPAGIRDLAFHNVTAVSECASLLYGNPDFPIEGIRIEDMRLTIRGPMREKCHPGAVPDLPLYGCSASREIPHALYGRHLRDVSMTRVRVDWQDASGPWRSALRLDDAAEIELDRISAAPAPENPDGAAVHLAEVHGARVAHCRWASNRGAFLGLEDGTDGVSLHGNMVAPGAGLFYRTGTGTPAPDELKQES